MRVIVSTIVCFVFACLSVSVAAAAEDWVAARATSEVSYTTDKETWVPLRKGMAVPNKAWISTGPRGRLQLVRGSESIAFQPNTLASIITRGSTVNRKTEVVQQVGEISLEIEKRQKPHTTVQTPFLAAVVKGTRFTVQVGKKDAAVAVDRGLVQVTSFRSGERSELAAGQGARVDATGMTVAGISQKPAITRVAPSSPQVPAVGSVKSGTAKSDEASSTSSSNAGGNGKGNSGGNGNGNSGENGSSSGNNAGGNGGGNGNAGGNGNGNAGGNGKGKGKGNSDDDDDGDDD
jgi:hypothetical protein